MPAPIDRRPIYWDNWAPVHDGIDADGALIPYPDNPRCYQSLYLHEPYAFIKMQMERGQRVMSRMEMPTLIDIGQRTVPSSCWENIPAERRDIVVHEVNRRRREDPEFTWGIYAGHWWGSPHTTDCWTADSSHTPNLDIPEDRRRFEANFLPWKESCGDAFHEVFFDAAARPESFGGYITLVEQAWDFYRIKVGIEAYPHTLPQGGTWPHDIVWGNWIGVPMWCLARFYFNRNPAGDLAWPADSEVHIASTPHLRGPSAARPGYPAIILPEELEDLRNRNFICGSARPQLDASLLM